MTPIDQTNYYLHDLFSPFSHQGVTSLTFGHCHVWFAKLDK